jgi:hypothetical protein
MSGWTPWRKGGDKAPGGESPLITAHNLRQVLKDVLLSSEVWVNDAAGLNLVEGTNLPPITS